MGSQEQALNIGWVWSQNKNKNKQKEKKIQGPGKQLKERMQSLEPDPQALPGMTLNDFTHDCSELRILGPVLAGHVSLEVAPGSQTLLLKPLKIKISEN